MLPDELPLSESHAAEQTALKDLFAKIILTVIQSLVSFFSPKPTTYVILQNRQLGKYQGLGLVRKNGLS